MAKIISFIYLIKWYTWIISWGKYISMTFLKAKRCLTFNFMSIMKPSDHVRFWEAFVFHSTIDLKSYNRKNSVAIVTNNQRELQNLYDNIRFSIYFLISLSSCCQIQIGSLYKVYYLHNYVCKNYTFIKYI